MNLYQRWYSSLEQKCLEKGFDIIEISFHKLQKFYNTSQVFGPYAQILIRNGAEESQSMQEVEQYFDAVADLAESKREYWDLFKRSEVEMTQYFLEYGGIRDVARLEYKEVEKVVTAHDLQYWIDGTHIMDDAERDAGRVFRGEPASQWVEDMTKAARYRGQVYPSSNLDLWKECIREIGPRNITNTSSEDFNTAANVFSTTGLYIGKRKSFNQAVADNKTQEWCEAHLLLERTLFAEKYGVEPQFISLCMSVGTSTLATISPEVLPSVVRAYVIADEQGYSQVFCEGLSHSLQNKTFDLWIEHIEEALEDKDLIGGANYREVASK